MDDILTKTYLKIKLLAKIVFTTSISDAELSYFTHHKNKNKKKTICVAGGRHCLLF